MGGHRAPRSARKRVALDAPSALSKPPAHETHASGMRVAVNIHTFCEVALLKLYLRRLHTSSPDMRAEVRHLLRFSTYAPMFRDDSLCQSCLRRRGTCSAPECRFTTPEFEALATTLLVRIHFIIVMIRWTGLAPWEWDMLGTGVPIHDARVRRCGSYLYRGTSLIRNNPLLGHCSRTMSRAIWWP